jgi:macrolide-specific efflux system membrane fusion protein
MKKLFIFAAALALIAGGWYWWRLREARARAEPSREVVVVRGDIRETALATGTVEPQNRVELSSPVPGRIDDVLVREGDRVERGQTLALISSSERATLLDAARARSPDELARWERLFNPTPLIAPLDGTVIARLLEPGQSVSPDKPILVLSDRLIVRAQVDETDLARIAIGQPAEIRLDAYPRDALYARVAHIAYESKIVNNVVIYNVEILPDDLPPFVRSGMSASITFILRATNDVLVLPSDALRGAGPERKALIPAALPNRPPEARVVRVGIDDGRRVEILSGLEEGDRVLAPDPQLGAAGKQKSTPLLPFGGGGARRRM